MPPKLLPHNKRILEVLEEYQLKEGISNSEAMRRIGFNSRNTSKLKRGESGFTIPQLVSICQLSGVSANWILGLSSTKYSSPQNELQSLDLISVLELTIQELKARK
jgi:DNA-binding Xre family transcriptional regulator